MGHDLSGESVELSFPGHHMIRVSPIQARNVRHVWFHLKGESRGKRPSSNMCVAGFAAPRQISPTDTCAPICEPRHDP
jgi:hypothetical protein